VSEPDVRATQRLLEVIGEHVDLANKLMGDLLLMNVPGSLDDLDVLKARDELDLATEAILELRRRGDALVWARDVELVVQVAYRERISLGDDEAKALARLHHALGGVL
jgi:hypothetical protein